MYISHSVMEGHRHVITPLTRVAFVYNGPKGMELAPITHIIVEVAKALGGSFKLVTLAPKPVRVMTRSLLRGVFVANHLASNNNLTRTTKRQNTYNEN